MGEAQILEVRNFWIGGDAVSTNVTSGPVSPDDSTGTGGDGSGGSAKPGVGLAKIKTERSPNLLSRSGRLLVESGIVAALPQLVRDDDGTCNAASRQGWVP